MRKQYSMHLTDAPDACFYRVWRLRRLSRCLSPRETSPSEPFVPSWVGKVHLEPPPLLCFSMRLWGGAVDGAFPAATPFSDLRVITQDDGKGSPRVCDSGNTNDLGRIDMAKGGSLYSVCIQLFFCWLILLLRKLAAIATAALKLASAFCGLIVVLRPIFPLGLEPLLQVLCRYSHHIFPTIGGCFSPVGTLLRSPSCLWPAVSLLRNRGPLVYFVFRSGGLSVSR